MQVRCVRCWEVYNDRMPHQCAADCPDPRQETSPARPPSNLTSCLPTLTLSLNDVAKLDASLKAMAKSATRIGTQLSEFCTTVSEVTSLLTNVPRPNGTTPLTKSSPKKPAEISGRLDATTFAVLTQAAARAVLLLTELQHPYSLDELTSRLHGLHHHLSFDQCREISHTVLIMLEDVSPLRASPSPTKG